MFSVLGTTQMTLTLGLRAARARITPSMVAPPAMSYFIFSMPSAGLMEMPPVSKVTAFADQADDRGAGLWRIGRRVGDDDHARRLGTALGYAEEGAHLQVGDLLFVENFDGQAGLLGHGFGFFRQDLGSELVGRFVDQVAREILGVGDDAAAAEALFAGGRFFVGVARQHEGVDGLVVLLVGLVFVGLEIGCYRTFGDGLRGVFGEVAFPDEEGEALDGAGL